MARFTFTLFLSAAPKTVYANLTRAETRTAMLPDVASCTAIEATPSATWQETHHVEEDELVWDFSMTAIEPNQRITYSGTTSGMTQHVTITIAPESQGTRLNWEQKTTFDTWLHSVVGWFVHRSQRAKLRHTLSRFYYSA